jgi:hypothetical protein
MLPDDHNALPEAGTGVRYLPPQDDPDMQEYDNEGDAIVVEAKDGE